MLVTTQNDHSLWRKTKQKTKWQDGFFKTSQKIGVMLQLHPKLDNGAAYKGQDVALMFKSHRAGGGAGRRE